MPRCPSHPTAAAGCRARTCPPGLPLPSVRPRPSWGRWSAARHHLRPIGLHTGSGGKHGGWEWINDEKLKWEEARKIESGKWFKAHPGNHSLSQFQTQSAWQCLFSASLLYKHALKRNKHLLFWLRTSYHYFFMLFNMEKRYKSIY